MEVLEKPKMVKKRTWLLGCLVSTTSRFSLLSFLLSVSLLTLFSLLFLDQLNSFYLIGGIEVVLSTPICIDQITHDPYVGFFLNCPFRRTP
jgi:hypothetical protein